MFGTRYDTRFILWCLIDSFSIYTHLKYYSRLGCQQFIITRKGDGVGCTLKMLWRAVLAAYPTGYELDKGSGGDERKAFPFVTNRFRHKGQSAPTNFQSPA